MVWLWTKVSFAISLFIGLGIIIHIGLLLSAYGNLTPGTSLKGVVAVCLVLPIIGALGGAIIAAIWVATANRVLSWMGGLPIEMGQPDAKLPCA